MTATKPQLPASVLTISTATISRLMTDEKGTSEAARVKSHSVCKSGEPSIVRTGSATAPELAQKPPQHALHTMHETP